jgi:alpha-galactosidase
MDKSQLNLDYSPLSTRESKTHIFQKRVLTNLSFVLSFMRNATPFPGYHDYVSASFGSQEEQGWIEIFKSIHNQIIDSQMGKANQPIKLRVPA